MVLDGWDAEMVCWRETVSLDFDSNSTVRGETSGLARGRALLSAHAVVCQEMVGILEEFARRIRGRIDVFR